MNGNRLLLLSSVLATTAPLSAAASQFTRVTAVVNATTNEAVLRIRNITEKNLMCSYKLSVAVKNSRGARAYIRPQSQESMVKANREVTWTVSLQRELDALRRDSSDNSYEPFEIDAGATEETCRDVTSPDPQPQPQPTGVDIPTEGFRRLQDLGVQWMVITSEDNGGLNCRDPNAGWRVASVLPRKQVIPADDMVYDDRPKPYLYFSSKGCAGRATTDRFTPVVYVHWQENGAESSEWDIPWSALRASRKLAVLSTGINCRSSGGQQYPIVTGYQQGAVITRSPSDGIVTDNWGRPWVGVVTSTGQKCFLIGNAEYLAILEWQ